MTTDSSQPAVIAALQALLEQLSALPGDQQHLSVLNPEQRRDAHALAARLQDGIAGLLSQLVADMASDGADLVDAGGLPRSYDAGSDT